MNSSKNPVINSNGQIVTSGGTGYATGASGTINTSAPIISQKYNYSLGYPNTPIPTIEGMAYWIMRMDGMVAILTDQTSMTPRQIVGFSKFMALIQTCKMSYLTNGTYATASLSHDNMNIDWSTVINDLNITDLFTITSPPSKFEDNVLTYLMFDFQ